MGVFLSTANNIRQGYEQFLNTDETVTELPESTKENLFRESRWLNEFMDTKFHRERGSHILSAFGGPREYEENTKYSNAFLHSLSPAAPFMDVIMDFRVHTDTIGTTLDMVGS